MYFFFSLPLSLSFFFYFNWDWEWIHHSVRNIVIWHSTTSFSSLYRFCLFKTMTFFSKCICVSDKANKYHSSTNYLVCILIERALKCKLSIAAWETTHENWWRIIDNSCLLLFAPCITDVTLWKEKRKVLLTGWLSNEWWNQDFVWTNDAFISFSFVRLNFARNRQKKERFDLFFLIIE